MTESRIYYARVDKPMALNDLVALSGGQPTGSDIVQFSNAWGGFVYSSSKEHFAENFAEVSPEQIQRLLTTFEPITVALGDDSDEGLPAFSNGERWNGWHVPYLTLETILDAMTDDGFLTQRGMDRVSRFLYVPAHNDLMEISNFDGGEFEDGQAERIDYHRILEIATSEDEDEAAELFASMGLQVAATRKAVVKEEGKDTPTVVFNIGDGWCWEEAPSAPALKHATPTP